jgi:PQQ-dependent dehydrogenase (methanol/ethanol family)
MTQKRLLSALRCSLFSLFLSPLASAQTAVDEAMITDPGTESWPSYGRSYSEQRFSPLNQITADNVKELGLAWSFEYPTNKVMEATPLLIDGKLISTSAWSRVFAFDAKTGELLWDFDPNIDKAHRVNLCCGPANRGAAAWGDSVFVGTLDGRLVALDINTGKPRWSVQTTPENSHYSITGAPRVVKGQVIIGNGGADLGARGYISAYDANTGAMNWRFYTVPGNPAEENDNKAMAQARETWNGNWWEFGGGGTAWDGMAYDPELNLLYIGTGNGSPWNRELRSPGGGDNLYLSTILAINPDNGEYVWHYQTTPADNWDYTAVQQLMLAELEIDGKETPVIMQAPKNGFFYVLDRRNGKLLSAEAYSRINWATHVDMATGRPVETETANYQKNGPQMIYPAPFGAHNWQPMAFNEQTGLVYIPKQVLPGIYGEDKDFKFTEHRWNTGVDFFEMRNPGGVRTRAMLDSIVFGELLAWDPVKGQAAWTVKHDTPANGGILSTAGNLVFQGRSQGSFHAYRADNGEELWSFGTDSAVLGGPMTYTIDGEQYVAVNQGSGGALMLAVGEYSRGQPNPNRLLVFKLGGKASFEKKPAPNHQIAELPANLDLSEETLMKGEMLYERNCGACHGISVEGGGVLPDLRYLTAQEHQEFAGIVFGGTRRHKGMVGFHETLNMEDVSAIQSYIGHQTIALKEEDENSLMYKLEYWFFYWLYKAIDLTL